MSRVSTNGTVKSATERRQKTDNVQRRTQSADLIEGVKVTKKPIDQRRTACARSAMPSDKLNPKVIDPFHKTSGTLSKFASLYSSGSVPCRLVHGSVRHKLQWDTPPENLNFDPMLVTLSEGLREAKHPYSFIAREGFKQMLDVSDAAARTEPILGKLMPPIRLALGSNDGAVFQGTLDAIVQLSNVVGPALNCHLRSILPMLGKQMLTKTHKEAVTSVLHQIEFNGGKECVALIKSRVPTYSSAYN